METLLTMTSFSSLNYLRDATFHEQCIMNIYCSFTFEFHSAGMELKVRKLSLTRPTVAKGLLVGNADNY